MVGVYNNIKINSISGGSIEFEIISPVVEAGVLWSGIINIVKFKKIASGRTEIKLNYQGG